MSSEEREIRDRMEPIGKSVTTRMIREMSYKLREIRSGAVDDVAIAIRLAELEGSIRADRVADELLAGLRSAANIFHRSRVRQCCNGPDNGGFDAAEIFAIDGVIAKADGFERIEVGDVPPFTATA